MKIIHCILEIMHCILKITQCIIKYYLVTVPVVKRFFTRGLIFLILFTIKKSPHFSMRGPYIFLFLQVYFLKKSCTFSFGTICSSKM